MKRVALLLGGLALLDATFARATCFRLDEDIVRGHVVACESADRFIREHLSDEELRALGTRASYELAPGLIVVSVQIAGLLQLPCLPYDRKYCPADRIDRTEWQQEDRVAKFLWRGEESPCPSRISREETLFHFTARCCDVLDFVTDGLCRLGGIEPLKPEHRRLYGYRDPPDPEPAKEPTPDEP